MLRSLNSGISGMRNHQTRMDVIADNIANVNTVGFKYSRVIFKDVLSQSIRGSSSSQVGAGSINPSQVGMGVTVGSIDRVFSQGSSDPTSRSTDLTISGNGFFVVADYKGEPNAGDIQDLGTEDLYLTRDGAFYIDDNGYLVNSLGQYVLGIRTRGDGSNEAVTPINLKNVNFSGDEENEYIESVSIGRDGMLTINGKDVFEDGANDFKLYVGIYQYENPEALVRVGNNLYECPGDANGVNDSGDINTSAGLNFGGMNGCGDIMSGNLEMSNVDLSREFSSMIITQRGYQANARVITVSDQMLQELVDLKR